MIYTWKRGERVTLTGGDELYRVVGTNHLGVRVQRVVPLGIDVADEPFTMFETDLRRAESAQ